MQQATTEPLLTSREAADFLRHNERTLIRWRVLRTGPAFVRCGRKVLYRRCDLESWLTRVEPVRKGAA